MSADSKCPECGWWVGGPHTYWCTRPELPRVVNIRRSKWPCGNGGEHNPDCFDPDCPFDAPDPEVAP